MTLLYSTAVPRTITDSLNMIIDVHCHIGFSQRSIDDAAPRVPYETPDLAGADGCDSYFSPRMLNRAVWHVVSRALGLGVRRTRGPQLDARLEAINNHHWFNLGDVERLVLLAFDAYHDGAGRAVGPVSARRARGSDLYVSNSLVRAVAAQHPDRLLFGGSIHPYRTCNGHSAVELLVQLADAGAVLIKWLPVHQNISASDSRTVEFMKAAAALDMPLLIHYGGESALTPQHGEFVDVRPMLGVLRGLRDSGTMPTVIIAHMATPTFRWQSSAGCRALVHALLTEFRDAPLYADISALASFGRSSWLREFARMPELHDKLVWGSDYPIPVLLWPYRYHLDRTTRRRIAACPSWIERDYQLKRALGFDCGVFTRAADLLRRGPGARGHQTTPA